MSEYILRQTREIVIDKANGICEYCLIAEADGYFRFQIDHVISLKHGGPSTIENLALACIFCNSYKGSDIGT